MKRLLLALLWLCVSALLGYWVSTTWLPDRVRRAVETGVGEALQGPVRVDAVRLRIGLRPVVEAERLEAWPGAEGPALRAETVDVTLDGAALLLGDVHVAAVRLDGVTLQVSRAADGALAPAALFALLRGEPPGGAAAPTIPPGISALERLRRGLHGLRGLVLPDLVVELARARVVWRDAAAGSGPALERALALDAGRLAFGTGADSLQIALRGVLVDDRDRARGALELSAERTGPASAHAVLAATQLDLAALAPYVDEAVPIGLRGTVTGSLEARLPPNAVRSGGEPAVGREAAADRGAGDGGALALELDLRVADLRLAPAGPASQPFSSPEASLRASVSIEERRSVLLRCEIESGADRLSLTGTLPRPARDDAPAELTLRIPRLTLARARELAAHLPRDGRAAAARALAPLESGELGPIELHGAAPLARWRALVDTAGARVPSEIELTASVRDVALRLDAEDRLEGVAGEVRFAGDRLDLRGVRGRLAGDPLPTLDVSFSGVSRLLAGERFAARPGSPAHLPGLRPLQRFLARDPADPDRTPRWSRLRIDAEFLHHPALVLPLEDAHAELAPTQDGLHWIVERARFGGVPIDAEGDYFDPPNERVVLSIRAVGERGPRPRLDARGEWGRARFALVMTDRPDANVGGAAGWARLSDATLRLFDAEVWLRGEGVLRGDAAIGLSEREAAPYDLRFTLAQPNAGDLARMLGGDGEALSGRLEAHGVLQGRLAPGHALLDGARGSARATARDGEMRQRMPMFVAIASVSETLNPFAKRDRIRYRKAEGELALADGRLSSETIAVDSPDLRLFVSGSVDITAPYDTRAVVGLFFFGKVSSMIGLVPIVNRVLLGENQSLAGAYFQLAGPWANPTATLVPMRSLAATGPATLVREGLPSFVRGGLDAIESVLGRGADAPAPEEAPGSAPPSAPATPPGALP